MTLRHVDLIRFYITLHSWLVLSIRDSKHHILQESVVIHSAGMST